MFGAKKEERESKTQDRAKNGIFASHFISCAAKSRFLFLRKQTETLATQALFISIAKPESLSVVMVMRKFPLTSFKVLFARVGITGRVEKKR